MVSKRKKGISRANGKRPVEKRNLRKRVLIACEGEKTEKNYFKALTNDFRIASEVEVVHVNENTDKLRKEVVKLKEDKDCDEAWYVFDKDEFPSKNFNDAVNAGISGNVKAAFSNICFELWYVLHFDFHTTQSTCDAYQAKLSEKLGRDYAKNDATIYEVLKEHTLKAVNHAKKLHQECIDQRCTPTEADPCTTVYLLVERLREIRREQEHK